MPVLRVVGKGIKYKMSTGRNKRYTGKHANGRGKSRLEPKECIRGKSLFKNEPENTKLRASDVIRSECLNHGYRLEDNTLGEGAYAKVKLAEVLSGKLARNKIMAEIVDEMGDFEVAIKIIDKKIVPTEFMKKFLPRELSNHSNIPHHQNIVRIYEHFSTQEYVFVVMEYCERGDLLDLINRDISDNHRGIGEDLSKKLFRQMCIGLEHCHKNGIVHRDIKCENILLDVNNDVKITDFGFSCHLEDPNAMLRTSCGSYAYTAPEVIKSKPYDGFRSDIWSLGVILFAMVNGRLPYNDNQLAEMDEDMRMQRLRFERHVSFECMVLIRKILQYKPDLRPTISEIMSDPWLTGKKPIPRQLNRPKWVSPYVAKKGDADPSIDELVLDCTPPPATSPVCFRAAERARCGTGHASVTLNYEMGETVTLKSRGRVKKNIWASAATPRPTTWPRTRKENARFKKASTRNQQGVVRPLGERAKPRDQHGTRCDSTMMSQILTVQQEVARDIRAKDRQESKANPNSYRYGSTWLLQNRIHTDNQSTSHDIKSGKVSASGATPEPHRVTISSRASAPQSKTFRSSAGNVQHQMRPATTSVKMKTGALPRKSQHTGPAIRAKVCRDRIKVMYGSPEANEVKSNLPPLMVHCVKTADDNDCYPEPLTPEDSPRSGYRGFKGTPRKCHYAKPTYKVIHHTT